QAPRLNAGFEPERDLGLRITRELLDLDDDLEPRGGRRILIDVKHMSARARKEYYEAIVRPYNANYEHWSADKQARYGRLPVLFSHAAYAGADTLDTLIEKADREHDHYHVPPFYAWNINLCDEDIREVHASGGLIGLCFDQRICGVGARHK